MSATSTTITRPYSKLNRLCAEAAKRGGSLRTFAAVAQAIKVTAGRVTQIFGFTQERDGSTVASKTLGLIVGAFTRDGITVEVDWFYLDYDEFAARVTAAPGGPPVVVSDDWDCDQTLRLRSLVELRLHPPGLAGELKTTLLFGTARCEYDPEDGQGTRAVAIGLRDARFAIDSGSYRLAAGTMIGERDETKDLKNFVRVAGGIDIVGPLVDGVLKDDPFANHYLGVLERANGRSEPFAVTIAAHGRSFVVRDADTPNSILSENKDAILNLLVLRRCERDEENRAVLVHATLQHR